MANTTVENDASVEAFLAGVADAGRAEDARALVAMMTEVSGLPPAMWGPSIIGFGGYRYRYDSGREGEMCRIGFSPRAKEQVLYLLHDTAAEAALLARLGKHRTGKGCLYIKRLGDVDQAVLGDLITQSWAEMARRYPV